MSLVKVQRLQRKQNEYPLSSLCDLCALARDILLGLCQLHLYTDSRYFMTTSVAAFESNLEQYQQE